MPKFRSTAILLAISACASQPMGPTAPVMPASGKPFAVFQDEQSACKQFADQQVAGGADQANMRQAGTALMSTILGAGLGAAVGGGWHGRDPGRGAEIGAATGAIGGTWRGAGQAAQAQGGLQYRYDLAYTQCMAAHGNQIPGQAQMAGVPPPGSAPLR